MTEYVFKSNSAGYWSVIFSSLVTIFFIFLSRVLEGYPLIQFIVILIGFKLGLYKSIDYLFSKKLVRNKDNFAIKIGLLSLGINTLDSFLIIEKDELSINNYAHSFGLYIVRNNKKWYNRLFKNRIKLLPMSNKYDIEEIMFDVSRKFNLRCIDMREV